MSPIASRRFPRSSLAVLSSDQASPPWACRNLSRPTDLIRFWVSFVVGRCGHPQVNWLLIPPHRAEGFGALTAAPNEIGVSLSSRSLGPNSSPLPEPESVTVSLSGLRRRKADGREGNSRQERPWMATNPPLRRREARCVLGCTEGLLLVLRKVVVAKRAVETALAGRSYLRTSVPRCHAGHVRECGIGPGSSRGMAEVDRPHCTWEGARSCRLPRRSHEAPPARWSVRTSAQNKAIVPEKIQLRSTRKKRVEWPLQLALE